MNIKWIKPIYAKYFFVSFISGLLIHLYMITNKLPLADDIAFSPMKTNGCSLSSGRWFLDYYNLSSGWNIPIIRGFLALLFGSLAVVLLINLWNIESKLAVLLFAFSFWAFPFNASVFTQMYMADVYYCGIFLAIVGCFLFIKYRNILSLIIASTCFACATGIYQSLILFAIMCLLCTFLLYTVSRQDCFFSLIREGLEMCFALVCGIILYKVILNEELVRNNVELTDYQGINNAGSISISSLLTGIKTAYYDYFLFLFSNKAYGFNTRLNVSINAIIVLMSIFFLVCLLSNTKNISNSIFSAFCVLIWPIAINFIYIMAPSANIYSLQKLQYVFLILFFIAVVELFSHIYSFDNTKKSYMNYFVIFVITINIFSGFLTVNKIYYKLQLNFYSTYAYYVELISNLKSEDAFDYEKPIIFVGTPSENINMHDTSIIDEISGFGWNFDNQDLIRRPAYGQVFCDTYLGLHTSTLNQDELTALYNSLEYKTANSYPYNGFAFEYNDKLIIKLGDYE